jgi:hypothetical protein
MPDRSKGKGQMKCSPSSSKSVVELGTNDHTPKKLLLCNHGGGQDPHRVVAPVNKRDVEEEENKKKTVL